MPPSPSPPAPSSSLRHPIVFETPGQITYSPGHQSRIGGLEGFSEFFQWQIGVGPPVRDVFHVLLPLGVEGLEHRVVQTIEFQGRDAESVTQSPVEGGGGFHPIPSDEEVGVAMEDEQIGAHGAAEPGCREVVPHVREAEAVGDTLDPGSCSQQDRLGDAESVAAGQKRAGRHGFGIQVDVIGFIAELVPNRVVEGHGLLPNNPRIRTTGPRPPAGELRPPSDPLRKRDDFRVAGVDEAARSQILLPILYH